MELMVQIGFNELVQAIKRLPPEERKNLHQLLEADTPSTPVDEERHFGSLKGMITYMADDFDAPLDDFKEYM